MIIAVVAVRVMQVIVHKIIGVIAVRNRFVTTANAMPVRFVMTTAGMLWCAVVRIFFAHFESMLVKVTFVRTMQMPVMGVINVSVMLDAHVPAIRAVDMFVSLVDFVF